MSEQSCFGILVDEELPEGWDDLPYEEKGECREAAEARATARWWATHPEGRHDAERWDLRERP